MSRDPRKDRARILERLANFSFDCEQCPVVEKGPINRCPLCYRKLYAACSVIRGGLCRSCDDEIRDRAARQQVALDSL